MNKKMLIIIVVILGLLFAHGWFLALIGGVGLLALEWAEKLGDILFEGLFNLAPRAAQMATAWSGLFLFIGALIWLGRWIRRRHLQLEAAALQEWVEDKAKMRSWWEALPWPRKLACIAAGLLALSLIVFF